MRGQKIEEKVQEKVKLKATVAALPSDCTTLATCLWDSDDSFMPRWFPWASRGPKQQNTHMAGKGEKDEAGGSNLLAPVPHRLWRGGGGGRPGGGMGSGYEGESKMLNDHVQNAQKP